MRKKRYKTIKQRRQALTRRIHQEACDELVESLEEIDEELDKVDILFVKIDEPQYAKKNKIKTFPAVGLYRQVLRYVKIFLIFCHIRMF